MQITKNQYRMLIQNGLQYSILQEADRANADYLLRCKYFEIPTDNDLWQTSTDILVRTPMGEMAIVSYRRERRKNILSIISIAISLCALCVSIFALFK